MITGSTAAAGFDLSRFSMRDMMECGQQLRKFGACCGGLAAVAESIVSHLYDNLLDEHGDRAALLVRLLKTHSYGRLGPELQAVVRGALGGALPLDSMKCLVLCATRGVEPDWNDRSRSRGHRAIPLRDAAFLEQAPMLSRLVGQLGLSPDQVVAPDPVLMRELARRQFNVFFVPEARGSPYVPAQEGFVVPFGVRSVLGFGAIFPSGNVFAVILFLRVAISPHTADMFKPLALSAKAALLDSREEDVFDGAPPAEQGEATRE